jgi:hypothetical protein
MAGKSDANNAVENAGSFDAMDFISADSVSGIRQRKWGLKNTIREAGKVC